MNRSYDPRLVREFSILLAGFFFKHPTGEVQKILMDMEIIADFHQIETYQSLMGEINDSDIFNRRLIQRGQ